jgi:hypothetical protein
MWPNARVVPTFKNAKWAEKILKNARKWSKKALFGGILRCFYAFLEFVAKSPFIFYFIT